jgi:hypothetical protein
LGFLGTKGLTYYEIEYIEKLKHIYQKSYDHEFLSLPMVGKTLFWKFKHYDIAIKRVSTLLSGFILFYFKNTSTSYYKNSVVPNLKNQESK